MCIYRVHTFHTSHSRIFLFMFKCHKISIFPYQQITWAECMPQLNHYFFGPVFNTHFSGSGSHWHCTVLPLFRLAIIRFGLSCFRWNQTRFHLHRFEWVQTHSSYSQKNYTISFDFRFRLFAHVVCWLIYTRFPLPAAILFRLFIMCDMECILCSFC